MAPWYQLLKVVGRIIFCSPMAACDSKHPVFLKILTFFKYQYPKLLSEHALLFFGVCKRAEGGPAKLLTSQEFSFYEQLPFFSSHHLSSPRVGHRSLEWLPQFVPWTAWQSTTHCPLLTQVHYCCLLPLGCSCDGERHNENLAPYLTWRPKQPPRFA